MVYHLCNPMTCQGFGMEFFGGCSFFWMGGVIIFFLIVFGRKYLGEEASVPFSFPGALIGGFGAYVIVGIFTCSYKLALVGGIAGIAILGIFLSNLFGGD